MDKREYRTPKLKVHGTVKQLTKSIKELGEPDDGLYYGNDKNPMNGSVTCVW